MVFAMEEWETPRGEATFSMRLCDVREVAEEVFDGELEGYAWVGVALGNHLLIVFILLYELVLHEMPNNLEKENVF